MPELAYRALRGMHDALPANSARLRALEDALIAVARQHNFREIRTPLLESTALFSRGVGSDSDIVNKEMYEFVDKSGESICLRPENTAAIARAVIEHGMLRAGVNKLWYLGPMFRHERPQKGRYRQFHQFGCEILGDASIAAEAELLALLALAFERLQLSGLKLHINSLGNQATRALYREQLRAYLQQHYEQLDPDSQRRLHSNPLRILDSKNEQTRSIVQQAPKLVDYLDATERQSCEQLIAMLSSLGVQAHFDPLLVRGLDYYTGILFEWLSDDLGAQGAVCGGGRYDNLLAELGGSATPATGFSIGLERLELLSCALPSPELDVYVVSLLAMQRTLPFIHTIRQRAPELLIEYRASSSKLKKQLQKADKSGARYALIVNSDADSLSLKNLRAGGEQQDFSYQQLDQLVQAINRNDKP